MKLKNNLLQIFKTSVNYLKIIKNKKKTNMFMYP